MGVSAVVWSYADSTESAEQTINATDRCGWKVAVAWRTFGGQTVNNGDDCTCDWSLMISSLVQGEAKDPAEEAREKHEAKLKQAQDANGAFQEITEDVLNEIFGGESWRRRGIQHLTFRSEVFNLKTLQGLLLQPIDLTFLESLDASKNSLTELDCVAGTSRKLKTAGVPQGILVFPSLQVLKLKKNLLTSFSLKLPALKELDLSYNRLEALPMLQIIPKLEVLLLDHNKISGPLTEVKTSSIFALKKLDLSYNQFVYSAVELNQQLQNLLNFDNLALKLKDYPFCATIPAYQILCLQKLPQLRRLDDIQSSDMEKQRKAACSESLNLWAMDESASSHESLKELPGTSWLHGAGMALASDGRSCWRSQGDCFLRFEESQPRASSDPGEGMASFLLPSVEIGPEGDARIKRHDFSTLLEELQAECALIDAEAEKAPSKKRKKKTKKKARDAPKVKEETQRQEESERWPQDAEDASQCLSQEHSLQRKEDEDIPTFSHNISMY
eukprot:s1730_g11.t1